MLVSNSIIFLRTRACIQFLSLAMVSLSSRVIGCRKDGEGEREREREREGDGEREREREGGRKRQFQSERFDRNFSLSLRRVWQVVRLQG